MAERLTEYQRDRQRQETASGQQAVAIRRKRGQAPFVQSTRRAVWQKAPVPFSAFSEGLPGKRELRPPLRRPPDRSSAPRPMPPACPVVAHARRYPPASHRAWSPPKLQRTFRRLEEAGPV